MTYEGLVLDLDEHLYHADPALSASGMKQLLKTPAHFAHYRQNPQKPRAEFDVGTAAHSKVLGVGAPIAVIPDSMLASNGYASTGAAKEFIAKARAEGKVPLKSDVAAEVDAMAESVLAHPKALALLEQDGHAEASLFATDPDDHIAMRCRFDKLAAKCADVKTTAGTADVDGFENSIEKYGYDVQAAHYRRVLRLVTGEDRPFLFIVVEKEPPYLVGVHILHAEFMEMGEAKAREARRRFREGITSGEWPGYGDDIFVARPKPWHVAKFQERYANV